MALLTTGLLVKWVAFVGSLHWPGGGLDLGVGGISYVELLIMSCGLVRGCPLKKRFLVIFGQGVQFQCRLFHLVQALIFGALVVSLGQ